LALYGITISQQERNEGENFTNDVAVANQVIRAGKGQIARKPQVGGSPPDPQQGQSKA
jgi:hypothetical protein